MPEHLSHASTALLRSLLARRVDHLIAASRQVARQVREDHTATRPALAELVVSSEETDEVLAALGWLRDRPS